MPRGACTPGSIDQTFHRWRKWSKVRARAHGVLDQILTRRSRKAASRGIPARPRSRGQLAYPQQNCLSVDLFIAAKQILTDTVHFLTIAPIIVIRNTAGKEDQAGPHLVSAMLFFENSTGRRFRHSDGNYRVSAGDRPGRVSRRRPADGHADQS